MPTIVEYITERRPLDAYPAWIISPPAPQACCRRQMVQISPVHGEGEWKFFYKRCPACGFTVRRFLPVPTRIDLEGIFGLDACDDLQAAG